MATKTAWEYAADLIDPPTDTWVPLPHQIEPALGYFAWMLEGGRGSGKTATAARKMHEHIHGPPCLPNVPGGHWPAIIAPTLGDGVTSCVNGPSGLRVHDKGVKVVQRPGGTLVIWPNGVEAKIFGAHTPEDVERLRSGGNRCFVWAEELAAWRYLEECWAHMRYGLRVGPWPHVVISTTPKNRRLIRELHKEAIESPTEIIITHATTNDNPYLDKRVKKALYRDYGKSRLGQQELLGKLLEDVEGAYWTEDLIERNRISPLYIPERFIAITVNVDPAVTSTGNEHGITVTGVTPPHSFLAADVETAEYTHGFVLADYSLAGPPNVWAKRVVEAYRDWQANFVVAEVNNGGEMVAFTMRTVDPSIPIRQVHASRGKDIRAEPVSSLYQQHRIHHVGTFPELEEQMITWNPQDPPKEWSPDRMDSMVWGFHELIVPADVARVSGIRDRRGKGRR